MSDDAWWGRQAGGRPGSCRARPRSGSSPSSSTPARKPSGPPWSHGSPDSPRTRASSTAPTPRDEVRREATPASPWSGCSAPWPSRCCSRVNRLPEKALVEYLRIAEVSPARPPPPRPCCMFTVAPAADGRLRSRRASRPARPRRPGKATRWFRDRTRREATPATIGTAVAVEQGAAISAVDLGGRVRPSGRSPRAGNALWVGLSVPPGVASHPVAGARGDRRRPAGAPPPGHSGGVAPLHAPRPRCSAWAVLDGGTAGPRRPHPGRDRRAAAAAGIVEIARAGPWAAAQPPAPGLPELRWLRALLGARAVPARAGTHRPPGQHRPRHRPAHDPRRALERLPDAPDGRPDEPQPDRRSYPAACSSRWTTTRAATCSGPRRGGVTPVDRGRQPRPLRAGRAGVHRGLRHRRDHVRRRSTAPGYPTDSATSARAATAPAAGRPARSRQARSPPRSPPSASSPR